MKKIIFDEDKLTYGTLNSRNSMGLKDLSLIDKQVKDVLRRINEGLITPELALQQEQDKGLRSGQFGFTRLLTLRDILKGDFK